MKKQDVRLRTDSRERERKKGITRVKRYKTEEGKKSRLTPYDIVCRLHLACKISFPSRASSPPPPLQPPPLAAHPRISDQGWQTSRGSSSSLPIHIHLSFLLLFIFVCPFCIFCSRPHLPNACSNDSVLTVKLLNLFGHAHRCEEM